MIPGEPFTSQNFLDLKAAHLNGFLLAEAATSFVATLMVDEQRNSMIPYKSM
jgi:hypothetical protein